MRTTALQTSVVAAFENRTAARQAVAELRQAGFLDSQIGVVSAGAVDSDQTLKVEENESAATGAVTGAAAGAGIGALWGLGIVAGVLPAIGPAIAGGTLAAILSSAAAGAATAGVAGMFLGLGMTDEEAAYYEGEVRGGRTVITVQAADRVEEAHAILHRNGGYEMT